MWFPRKGYWYPRKKKKGSSRRETSKVESEDKMGCCPRVPKAARGQRRAAEEKLHHPQFVYKRKKKKVTKLWYTRDTKLFRTSPRKNKALTIITTIVR